jgi:hypothetical protein
MKKKDIILLIYILSIIALLAIPASRVQIEKWTSSNPYLMGFIKTSILASSGEMIASRIKKGYYLAFKGLLYKFIIWGILGMGFVLMFHIYDKGVTSAINNSLLPAIGQVTWLSKIYTAFMISLIMNLTFAPAFMLLHRITDTYIEIGHGQLKSIAKTKFSQVTKSIDFRFFVEFVLLKTIPLFWIPAHTITFLLPTQYRVLMAGFLSIALGIILSLTKKPKQISNN